MQEIALSTFCTPPRVVGSYDKMRFVDVCFPTVMDGDFGFGRAEFNYNCIGILVSGNRCPLKTFGFGRAGIAVLESR